MKLECLVIFDFQVRIGDFLRAAIGILHADYICSQIFNFSLLILVKIPMILV